MWGMSHPNFIHVYYTTALNISTFYRPMFIFQLVSFTVEDAPNYKVTQEKKTHS